MKFKRSYVAIGIGIILLITGINIVYKQLSFDTTFISGTGNLICTFEGVKRKSIKTKITIKGHGEFYLFTRSCENLKQKIDERRINLVIFDKEIIGAQDEVGNIIINEEIKKRNRLLVGFSLILLSAICFFMREKILLNISYKKTKPS